MDYKPKKTDCGAKLADGGRCGRPRRPGQRTCHECHRAGLRRAREEKRARAAAMHAEVDRLRWHAAALRIENEVLRRRVKRLEDDLAMSHIRHVRRTA